MSGIDQYEFNVQVSATLEKVAFELRAIKSKNVYNDSTSYSHLLSIGDLSKLYGLDEYGFNVVLTQDYQLPLPDNFVTDLKATQVKLYALNEKEQTPVDLKDVFKITYDLQNGSIVTCFLASLRVVSGAQTYIKTVLVKYKGVKNTTGSYDTKAWIVDKKENPEEVLSPLPAYIFTSKVLLFPIENLSIKDGVYGAYNVPVTHGQWVVDTKSPMASILYKALSGIPSAAKIQTFTDTEIKQFWSNTGLGNPDLDYVSIFNHTLTTGQKVYI